MQAPRSLAFRERKRFELRQEAKASRTLRRYGFCEADVWTEEEADVAQELLRGLRVAARSKVFACPVRAESQMMTHTCGGSRSQIMSPS